MSSSRIIRSGEELSRLYILEPLAELAPATDQELFRPVRLGGEVEQEYEDHAEEEAIVPCIPEEEALLRITEARAEGAREGREEARGELAAACAALSQALLEIAPLKEKLMHEAEEDLLKLAVGIARKVMLRELATDPRVLAGLVRGALETASATDEIAVRLNPDQYPLVAECRELQELAQGERSISFKADPAIPPAGCVVETVRGTLDAGIDAQLDDILRRLLDEKSTRGARRGRK
jgi:flagellar assembly protein FliH